MDFGWQDIAALGIVFAAAGYLGRLAWGAVAGTGGGHCGTSCGGCPSASSRAEGASAPQEVVSIGMPPRAVR